MDSVIREGVGSQIKPGVTSMDRGADEPGV
jgi:hypothetical protein